MRDIVEMVLRWSAAGFLEAEKSFRRIQGYRPPWILKTALRGTTAEPMRKAAEAVASILAHPGEENLAKRCHGKGFARFRANRGRYAKHGTISKVEQSRDLRRHPSFN